jgi:hypothetical protein
MGCRVNYRVRVLGSDKYSDNRGYWAMRWSDIFVSKILVRGKNVNEFWISVGLSSGSAATLTYAASGTSASSSEENSILF